LDHQNNDVECLNVDDNVTKSFNILAASLIILHHYFNGPTKLFSDLYLITFLDISVKSFFPCNNILRKKVQRDF